MKLDVRLAKPEDDDSIRNLIQSIPMPGKIQLRFRRDPSYFDALVVEGHSSSVLVCHGKNSDIVGMGTCSEKGVYINGESTHIGYLSGLRIHGPYRSAPNLRSSYDGLKRLHERNRIPLYLTTVSSDNIRTQKLLESGRFGLPHYRRFGTYSTFALRPRMSRSNRPALQIRTATSTDLDSLFEFIRKHGINRQFFPIYEAKDLNNGLLKNLNLDDIFIVETEHGIQGCMGLWDQRAFRQNFIDSYNRPLTILRPFYNSLARIRQRPDLPPVRSVLQNGIVCFPVIIDNDQEVFNALLDVILARAKEKNFHVVLIGFHERDPLWKYARKRPSESYQTIMYVVHWVDGTANFAELDSRVPYLELGAL